MTDNLPHDVRSYNMSRIKSSNTSPEAVVRKFLFSKGLRYRKNDSRLPGKPDIVLPKFKKVVFVHGCFWHAHDNCDRFKWPKSNLLYWKPKLFKNKQRDIDNEEKLRTLGWDVIVVWECELKTQELREKRLSLLYLQITGATSHDS